MMIKRDRCRDTPRWCQGVTARSSDWDPASGLHQGQRSEAPRAQAGHMTAPRNDHSQLKSTLAQTEPSTHATTLLTGASTLSLPARISLPSRRGVKPEV